MPSFRQFEQFLAVAETLSFRRAADRLNMAQPALTTAIRRLEDEIGASLFVRTNKVQRLTPAGEVLRVEARRAITQADRAIALAKRASTGSTGVLRIGFLAGALRHLLPAFISDFRGAYPDIVLELEEGTTYRQVAGLLNDRLDVGIVALPLPMNTEPRIKTKILARSRMMAALPSSHSLARQSTEAIPLSLLANEPWVLFPAEDGPGLHETIMKACAKAGFAPHVTQRAIQMDTILDLVAAGLGISVVPARREGQPPRGVVFRELSGPGCPILHSVALAWCSNSTQASLTVFIDALSRFSKETRRT